MMIECVDSANLHNEESDNKKKSLLHNMFALEQFPHFYCEEVNDFMSLFCCSKGNSFIQVYKINQRYFITIIILGNGLSNGLHMNAWMHTHGRYKWSCVYVGYLMWTRMKDILSIQMRDNTFFLSSDIS